MTLKPDILFYLFLLLRQSFTILQAVRARGGVVSFTIAESVVIALIKRHPEYNLGHIKVTGSSFAQSILRRMKFVRRFGTTGKVQISEDLRQELSKSYLYGIVSKIEKHKIPHSMVLNLDQTPSKYVPTSNKTMAKQGSKTVPIKGSTDKRSITATFTITLEGHFLPIQLIYAGKTKKSLPRVDFPKSFSLSANPKHYSNESESIKILEDIIIPYVQKERKKLGLKEDHYALLIMDIFKGQMTPKVLNVLKNNHILLQSVPANFTYLFQPLDVQGGPNGYVKRLMKEKFSEWYTAKIMQALDAGKPLAEIEVDLKLSIIKPLHAKWIMEVYNHMTSEEGRKVCLKGWQVSGIKDAVEQGLSDLPSLDPFADIDPMLETGIDESEAQIQSDSLLEGSKYISESGYEDDESDCEYVDGDDVNDDEADDPFDDESESDDDENEE